MCVPFNLILWATDALTRVQWGVGQGDDLSGSATDGGDGGDRCLKHSCRRNGGFLGQGHMYGNVYMARTVVSYRSAGAYIYMATNGSLGGRYESDLFET